MKFIIPKKISPYIFLISFFIFSRWILWLIGIRFDATSLDSYIQYLDPAQLQNNLIQSIFYLHVQPPGFNFFLGVILKLFPQHYVLAFECIYQTMGLVFFTSLYHLLTKLNVRRSIALILVSIFMISPSVILYEYWLFYTYPIAVLIALSALFFHRYLSVGRLIDASLFSACIGGLVFIRGTYHWLWFLGWVIVVFKITKNNKIFLAALIPFILIFTLCIKNFIFFKSFSTSSTTMADLQLASVAFSDASKEQILPLVKEGKLSMATISEIDDFEKMGTWSSQNMNIPKSNIPVLDNIKKSSGFPNFNSLHHVLTTQLFKTDALMILKLHPVNYLKALARAFSVYFFPGPTDAPLFNRQYIQTYENYFNALFIHLNNINDHQLYSIKLRGIGDYKSITWDHLSRIFFGCTVIIYAGMFYFGWRTIWKAKEENRINFYTLIYIVINILYTCLINNVFSSFSNNRYRFEIDAFYLILLGILLSQIFERFKDYRLNRS